MSSCAKQPAALGGECEWLHECQTGMICLDRACAPHRVAGESCDDKQLIFCGVGLLCGDTGVCITAQEAEEKRKAQEEAAKRAMLVQSGLDHDEIEAAERPVAENEPAVGGGLAVRVSRTDSIGSGFAACRVDERLIGGSCESKGTLTTSVPRDFSATDTVGARWTCATNTKETPLVSYALCQQLPTASPERTEP